MNGMLYMYQYSGIEIIQYELKHCLRAYLLSSALLFGERLRDRTQASSEVFNSHILRVLEVSIVFRMLIFCCGNLQGDFCMCGRERG